MTHQDLEKLLGWKSEAREARAIFWVLNFRRKMGVLGCRSGEDDERNWDLGRKTRAWQWREDRDYGFVWKVSSKK